MFCTAKYRGGVRKTEGLVLQRYYMPSFQPLSSSLSLLCLSPIFPLRKHRGEVLVPSITGTERYVSPSSSVWSSHIGKVARSDGGIKIRNRGNVSRHQPLSQCAANIEKYRRNDNPLFLHDYYFLTLFNLAIHSYRHEHSDNHSYEYTYNQSYEP